MTRRLSAGILVGLILASLAACTMPATTSARRPTTTVRQTSTTAPTPTPLIWAQHALPAFSPADYTVPRLELSASDPNVAHLCVISQDGQAGTHLHVWLTDDRAAHWAEVVNHPVVNTSGASGSQRALDCHVAADLFDPSTAALVYFEDVTRPVPGRNVFTESYESSLSVTHDAGKTWQTLNPPTFLAQQAGTCGSGCDLRRLATVRGKTYAMFSNFHSPQYYHYAAIAVSTDNMRTWAPAGPPTSQVNEMRVNPTTGALLVASERGFGRHDYVVDMLWASPDGQAPWRNVQDFTGKIVFEVVANMPVASEPWKLCYSVSDSPNANTPAPAVSGTYCSADSGATWRRVGPLAYVNLVLAQDGSVYGIGFCDVQRLDLVTATWESLGRLPATGTCAPYTFVVNAGVEYPGESGHVVFWSIPIVGYGTPAASSPAVYTADYA